MHETLTALSPVNVKPMPETTPSSMAEPILDLHNNYPVCVLLDDQAADACQPRSRLYQGLHEQIDIGSPNALAGALDRMQTALERGLHAVMLLEYELGLALQELPPRENAPEPISQILLFDRVTLMTGEEVNAWLENRDCESNVTLTGWHSNISEHEFARAVDQIREHIAAGDTYQVNLCFAALVNVWGSPIALYRELRKQQAVPYGALIGLADGRWVLSRSPELFVRHRAGIIESQPMKGTAAIDSGLDLAQDPKNRAENVMIVDLLRNDLGRVAEAGSVSVPERFAVKRYGNVLQMTSTVRATLRPAVNWLELLRAVFPCGSITGAPKRSTMQIIGALERAARGLYTGAIGWVEPCAPGKLSDFCLSVPIRTLALSAPAADGQRTGTLGVGAGITWGSDSASEWAECALKSQFLSSLTTPVTLFETMCANRKRGINHLDRHLARLERSATALGFVFELQSAKHKLQAAARALPDDSDHRVRLDLAANGTIEVKAARLNPLPSPVKVMLAPETMDSSDFFLRHKTSNRARYDAAWQEAERQGAFDMLFFNERGELTEGGRSNVFVKLDGHWYTPPLEAGVLPGVMRGVLLEDPELATRERIILREELKRAQAVLLCNALRGAMPAQLMIDTSI